MSRRLLPVLLAPLLWLLPASSEAQVRLSVWGPSTTVTRENSTSFIEVTRRNNGAHVCTYTCEPNRACGSGACPNVPYNQVGSRLIYDSTREKLVSCNGVEVDGGECELADGVLSATTHLRMARLKIIPKAAPGYSGLSLNTVGAGVRLEFLESPDDYWSPGYYSGFGVTPQFAAQAAGKYKVIASDLKGHCAPTQHDPALTLTVPEGEDVELTIFFRATECTLTVNRTPSEGSPGGSVQTTPPGLTCGAAPTSPCTGKFAFGTQLTITPDPDGNVGYAFEIGNGCVPTTQPCKHEIRSDRSFDVHFDNSPPVGVDAGTESDEDAATPDGNGDGDGEESQPDASVSPGGGSNTDAGGIGSGGGDEPAAGGDGDGDGAGESSDDAASSGSSGSDGCTLQPGQASRVGGVFSALLLGLVLVLRRRRR